MAQQNGTRRRIWSLLMVMVVTIGVGMGLGMPRQAAAGGLATVEVVINSVHQLDDIDTAGAADFYAKVRIGDFPQERTGTYEDAMNITPNWTFRRQVARGTGLPVMIEIWDEDGGFNGGDDHVDINPNPGRSLRLWVNTTSEGIKHQDLVVIEGVAQSGGVVMGIAAGDEDDRARMSFTVRVYFDPSLTVYNESGSEVCYLYISPANDTTWGSDWLGTYTLPDGYHVTYTPTAGYYDLRAKFCSGGVYEEYDVPIFADRDWYIW